jgi:anti-sigma28 factor (negative regulator of flagellin synthesis)
VIRRLARGARGRKARMERLRRRIRRGTYRVDPDAVADAIVARLMKERAGR